MIVVLLFPRTAIRERSQIGQTEAAKLTPPVHPRQIANLKLIVPASAQGQRFDPFSLSYFGLAYELRHRSISCSMEPLA
jgi:hypothetical protein